MEEERENGERGREWEEERERGKNRKSYPWRGIKQREGKRTNLGEKEGEGRRRGRGRSRGRGRGGKKAGVREKEGGEEVEEGGDNDGEEVVVSIDNLKLVVLLVKVGNSQFESVRV